MNDPVATPKKDIQATAPPTGMPPASFRGLPEPLTAELMEGEVFALIAANGAVVATCDPADTKRVTLLRRLAGASNVTRHMADEMLMACAVGVSEEERSAAAEWVKAMDAYNEGREQLSMPSVESVGGRHVALLRTEGQPSDGGVPSYTLAMYRPAEESEPPEGLMHLGGGYMFLSRSGAMMPDGTDDPDGVVTGCLVTAESMAAIVALWDLQAGYYDRVLMQDALRRAVAEDDPTADETETDEIGEDPAA